MKRWADDGSGSQHDENRIVNPLAVSTVARRLRTNLLVDAVTGLLTV